MYYVTTHLFKKRFNENIELATCLCLGRHSLLSSVLRFSTSILTSMYICYIACYISLFRRHILTEYILFTADCTVLIVLMSESPQYYYWTFLVESRCIICVNMLKVDTGDDLLLDQKTRYRWVRNYCSKCPYTGNGFPYVP